MEGWVFPGPLGGAPRGPGSSCAVGMLTEAALRPQPRSGWFPRRRDLWVSAQRKKGGLSSYWPEPGWGRRRPAAAPSASGFGTSTEPRGGWLPSPQILASCPERPLWKLPRWEVRPAVPLSVTHAQAPELGLTPKDGPSKFRHVNSRPFRTRVCACLSLSFWGYISN